jgi:hypothetical protein
VRFLRAGLGRLDPWAALVLGVLLALGVVILLATPGPWHKVVGPAPPESLAPAAPTNVAVFGLGGPGGSCTALLWLHVDHVRPALGVVVLAPQTEGFVPGAGFTPLRQVVDEVGPGAGAAAMGQALGVTMDSWITLDSQALQLALAPRTLAGEARAPLLQYERAKMSWEGRGEALRVWATQYRALGSTLARLPFERINIVAFSNYVLGWGHVRSDLNLQGATTLATTFKALLPTQVDVRAAATIVQTCRRGEVWRVDDSAVAQLRGALTLGLTPPATGTKIIRQPQAARVLVVLPGPRYRADAYVNEVRRRLRLSAGAPVAVRAIAATRWDGLVARTAAETAAWPPLAVLVAPPRGIGGVETTQTAAAELRRLGESLRQAGQPAVMSAPLASDTTATAAPAADALSAAVRASGQPVSPLGGFAGSSADAPLVARDLDARLKAAAVANVGTLVRACWPGTLAPHLASTRLGFSFAARRRTTVAVSTLTSGAASAIVTLLRAWGYQTTSAPAAWTPPSLGPVLYYRKGMRRAALALAGDLDLRPVAIVADDVAPAALTLNLGR